MAERMTGKDLTDISALATLVTAAVEWEPHDVATCAAKLGAASARLVGEVRRLRSLLSEVYPLLEAHVGPNELQAELKREILFITNEGG